jgi:hypothetical protein
MTDEIRCCYIRPSHRQCPAKAEWQIEEEGRIYSDTYSCPHHLSEMLTDGVNIVCAIEARAVGGE